MPWTVQTNQSAAEPDLRSCGLPPVAVPLRCGCLDLRSGDRPEETPRDAQPGRAGAGASGWGSGGHRARRPDACPGGQALARCGNAALDTGPGHGLATRMAVYGLDWSSAAVDPGTAYKHGFRHAGRYLGRIGPAEVAADQQTGLGVGPLYWEPDQTAALHGFARGRQDAAEALAALQALGLQGVLPVLTVDFSRIRTRRSRCSTTSGAPHRWAASRRTVILAHRRPRQRPDWSRARYRPRINCSAILMAPVSGYAHIVQHSDVTPVDAPWYPGLTLLWGYDLLQAVRTDSPLIAWSNGSPYIPAPSIPAEDTDMAALITVDRKRVYVTNGVTRRLLVDGQDAAELQRAGLLHSVKASLVSAAHLAAIPDITPRP